MASVLRRIAARFLRYFDHRFEEIKALLREQPTRADTEQVVTSQVNAAMAYVSIDVAAAAEAVSGMAATMDRRITRFLTDQQARDVVQSGMQGRYTPELVAYLNHVLSFDGPIADRSLLMNHPLTVLFDEKGPRLFEVNERIVEIPFVLRACAWLSPGSVVVDVGATESTLALSLASMGHHVTALDPRPYPFTHPNLTVVAKDVEGWTPPGPAALVIAVSAVEHFGLGHYTSTGATPADADQRALERIRQWLAPHGRLVLTVPTGTASTDEFQRVYDEPRLKQLVDGWTIVEASYSVRTSEVVWEPVDAIVEGGRGVAMLVLE